MSYIGRIIEYVYGHRIPPSLVERFHKRLVEQKDDEAQSAALEAAWNRLGFPEMEQDRCDRAFGELQQRLGLAAVPSPTIRRGILPRRKAWTYAAACILPLALLISSFFFYREAARLNEDTVNVLMVEHFVPVGQRGMVVLPDSTRVWLNSETLLVYPDKFVGGKRSVYLYGEAYFEVEKDETKPFVVNLRNLDVEVLGTRFNVSSYPESKQITTTLEQGSVQVRLDGDEPKLFRLKPDEQLIYHTDSRQVELETVVSADYSEWRAGGIAFDNAPFKDVLTVLERTFGISVHLETSAYNGNRVTVHFNKHESLENIFMLLSALIPGLDYRIEGLDVYLE